MQTSKLSRRSALAQTGRLIAAATLGEHLGGLASKATAAPAQPASPIRFCLNTSTIRGQKLGIAKEIEIAAKAGYDAIEPWITSVQDYVRGGGTLKDLNSRFRDNGLTVEATMGFSEWIVDDDERRAKGLEQAKRDLDLTAQIGGKRLAAPPSGANTPGLSLMKAAERYRALLEAGDQAGVVPEMELWGHSRNLSRLSECVCVAVETGHPKACVLADVFHLYRGGSDIHGIQLLGPTTIQVLHMNDYPAEPPREKINDSYRVYPGDGVAPLTEIVKLLLATGGPKVLSLELFSQQYWSQDALTVAQTGLAKMKAVAAKAAA
jgi:2-keto-myo-inositol isomerase